MDGAGGSDEEEIRHQIRRVGLWDYHVGNLLIRNRSVPGMGQREDHSGVEARLQDANARLPL